MLYIRVCLKHTHTSPIIGVSLQLKQKNKKSDAGKPQLNQSFPLVSA